MTAAEVTLRLLGDEAVPVTVVEERFEGDPPHDLRLVVSIAPERFADVDLGAQLHLLPGTYPQDEAAAMHAAPEVHLELRPATTLVGELAAHADEHGSVGAYLAHLSESAPDHELLGGELWWVTAATRPEDVPADVAGNGASLRSGFRTTWYDAESLGPEAGIDLSAMATAVAGNGAAKDEPETLGVEPLFAVVQDFFSARDLPAERQGRATVVRVEGDAGDEPWVLYVQTDEEDEECVVHAVLSDTVPPDRRSVMLELLGRANSMLTVSCFVLDLDSGTLSCRAGLDVMGDRLSEELLAALVAQCVGAMDELLPAVEAVLAGDDAVTALRGIAE